MEEHVQQRRQECFSCKLSSQHLRFEWDAFYLEQVETNFLRETKPDMMPDKKLEALVASASYLESLRLSLFFLSSANNRQMVFSEI